MAYLHGLVEKFELKKIRYNEEEYVLSVIDKITGHKDLEDYRFIYWGDRYGDVYELLLQIVSKTGKTIFIDIEVKPEYTDLGRVEVGITEKFIGEVFVTDTFRVNKRDTTTETAERLVRLVTLMEDIKTDKALKEATLGLLHYIERDNDMILNGIDYKNGELEIQIVNECKTLHGRQEDAYTDTTIKTDIYKIDKHMEVRVQLNARIQLMELPKGIKTLGERHTSTCLNQIIKEENGEVTVVEEKYEYEFKVGTAIVTYYYDKVGKHIRLGWKNDVYIGTIHDDNEREFLVKDIMKNIS